MKTAIHPFLIAGLLSVALVACKKDEPPAPAVTPAPAPSTPAQTTPSAPPPVAAPAPAEKPITVVEVQLAKTVGDDMRAAEPTTTFAPTDAIHAVVLTEGTGGTAKLAAKWTYGADRQPVHQEEHDITPTGAGAHNFRITKADGFPAGDYQVEILLNGAVAATRSFKVE